MATYKGIQGYSVQKLSSDPTVEDTIGQLWYNSSTGKFKISTEGAGAWASATALPTATNNGAGFGIVTAAMSAGGYTPGGATNNCQTYNGSVWTEVNNMTRSPSEYSNRGAGTLTAGVTWGGTPVTGKTENWDGTCWTASGVMNTGRYTTAALGIQTAAMAAGGYIDPATANQSETYNGTSWTSKNDIQTGRQGLAGAGTTTAAVIFGGNPNSTASETYDGTSWSTTNSLNTGRSYAMGTGDSVPAAIAFGGSPAVVNTEKYDGTCWTEVANLATGRGDGQEAGTGKASALCIGGEPPRTTVVEEWSDPVYSIKTVTVS